MPTVRPLIPLSFLFHTLIPTRIFLTTGLLQHPRSRHGNYRRQPPLAVVLHQQRNAQIRPAQRALRPLAPLATDHIAPLDTAGQHGYFGEVEQTSAERSHNLLELGSSGWG